MRKWKIEFSKGFLGDLDNLPPEVREKVQAVIKQLAESDDPTKILGAHKLEFNPTGISRWYYVGDYPCQWTDIVDRERTTIATIMTLKEARRDDHRIKPVVKKEPDGVWTIIIDVPELTAEIVDEQLLKLKERMKK